MMTVNFIDFNLYVSSFIIGFLGSSHCIGMCGGIQQLFQNMAPKNQVNISLYLYNLGRVSGYLLITLITSIFVFSFVEQTKSLFPWVKILRISSGLIMIYLGLNKLFGFKLPFTFSKYSSNLWLKVRQLASPILPPQNLIQVYGVGIIWGFIPCSLIYSALAVSLTASSIPSSLFSIFCFGLGTMPVLIGFGTISQQLKQQKKYKILLAILLISIGVYTIAMPMIMSKMNSMNNFAYIKIHNY